MVFKNIDWTTTVSVKKSDFQLTVSTNTCFEPLAMESDQITPSELKRRKNTPNNS
jgi:hypothetical protein